MAGSKGTGGVAVAAAEEEGKKYIRFTVDADTEMKDVVRANVNLDTTKTAGLNWKTAPVVAIGYRTNSQINKVNTNPTFHNNGMIARIWGCNLEMTNDKNWNKLVFDASAQRWTGGENGVAGTNADERIESVENLDVNGFVLKPFQNLGSTINAGSYFDVEYVAYFKTVEDANAYVYGK